ncbi:MAG: S41 family peptidase, partial [Pseudohongiellaceae bacterium]
MNHSFRLRLALLSSAVLLGLNPAVRAADEPLAPDAAAAAVAPAATRAPEDLPLPLDEVRIFAQVLNQIRNAYVEDIDDKTLLENAIKGMLAGIDPHSTYLASDDYESLQESTTGEFGGLGVEVGIENGFIKIIAPMDDSPADRA